MNNIKAILKSKRFLTAAVITVATVAVIIVQKKADPILEIELDA